METPDQCKTVSREKNLNFVIISFTSFHYNSAQNTLLSWLLDAFQLPLHLCCSNQSVKISLKNKELKISAYAAWSLL